MMTGIMMGAIGVIVLGIGYKVVARVIRYTRDIVSAAASVATDF